MDDSVQKPTTSTSDITTSSGRPSIVDTCNGNTAQKNNDNGNDKDGIHPPNKLMVFWMSIVVQWRIFTVYLYDSTVVFAAEFISDILSHPRLQNMLVDIIVRSINAFMDQEDIGTKMDDTARRVIYDRAKAKQTSRALGKEVVPMVTGFVGGMASSFTPSMVKKRNRRKKKNRNKQNSGSSELCDKSSLNADAGVSDEEDFEKQESNDGWFSNTKKSK